MRLQLIAMVLIGVAGAACGESTAHDTQGASGSSGSGVDPAGSSGQLGTTSGGGSGGQLGTTGGRGGSGGQLGATGGRVGSAGQVGAVGGATSTAGTGSPAGSAGSAGTSVLGQGGAAGLAGLAGSSGTAGELGAAGAEDGGGELAEGVSDVTVEMISGGKSASVTNCVEDAGTATVVAYPDGVRIARINCQPAGGGDGDFSINDLSLVFYSTSLGEHDASELYFICDDSSDHCEGQSVTAVYEVADGSFVYLDSPSADTKSGTFTLDEFTASGRVSGSVDVTMSKLGYQVTVQGHFASHLLDCGPAATAGDGICLGRRN